MKCLGGCFQVSTFILGTAFPSQSGFDHFHENLPPLIHTQKDSWFHSFNLCGTCKVIGLQAAFVIMLQEMENTWNSRWPIAQCQAAVPSFLVPNSSFLLLTGVQRFLHTSVRGLILLRLLSAAPKDRRSFKTHKSQHILENKLGKKIKQSKEEFQYMVFTKTSRLHIKNL